MKTTIRVGEPSQRPALRPRRGSAMRSYPWRGTGRRRRRSRSAPGPACPSFCRGRRGRGGSGRRVVASQVVERARWPAGSNLRRPQFRWDLNPNWIFLSGWRVMNQVAIKEAAAINYPMDHFIGNWWSSSDADVIPAGDGAKGYVGATFHAPGAGFKIHRELFKHAY